VYVTFVPLPVTDNRDLLLLLLATSATPVIVTFGVPALPSNVAVFAITAAKATRAVALLLNSSAVIPEKVWEVVKLTTVTVALVGALVVVNVGTLVGLADGA
jgi:hypothetical protein